MCGKLMVITLYAPLFITMYPCPTTPIKIPVADKCTLVLDDSVHLYGYKLAEDDAVMKFI